MSVTPCPVCDRAAIPSDSPTFDSLKNVLPEYLPAVRACVECFDRATSTARTFARGDRGLALNGRTFDSATALAVSDGLSRLYADHVRPTAPGRPFVPSARAKFTVDGTDLRLILSEALNLDSLASLTRRLPQFTVNRRSSHGGVSGFFKGSEFRVHLCVRADATLADATGVLLHELAHAACYAESLGYRDTDADFAAKCREVMDEWTAKNPDRPVDHVVYGAYRGADGRRNKAEIRRRDAVVANLAPDAAEILRAVAKSNPVIASHFFADGRVTR